MTTIAEQVEKLEVCTKDICGAHFGKPIGKCPYCRIEELVAKCIHKNSEYQIMFKIAQTYKDALVNNPLMRSESLALFWMNKAMNLQEQLTHIKCQ